MKIDTNIIDRIMKFNRRNGDLIAEFVRGHKYFKDMAEDKQLVHLKVLVGDLLPDESFDVSFANIQLKVRYAPELSNAGVAAGKVHFLEKIGHPQEPERLVGAIRFNPSGGSDLRNEEGDELGIANYLFEVALHMFEAILRDRADNSVPVGFVKV